MGGVVGWVWCSVVVRLGEWCGWVSGVVGWVWCGWVSGCGWVGMVSGVVGWVGVRWLGDEVS